VKPYDPSYSGDIGRKITVPGQLGKKGDPARHQWLTLVFLATQEAEIRIPVRS
jgi:hypothetical protein